MTDFAMSGEVTVGHVAPATGWSVRVASHNRFSGSRRLRVDAAPGGLCLIQDVVNSDGIPAFSIPDLLSDPSVAQRWLDEALRTWSAQTGQRRQQMSLGHRDIAPLRRLRTGLRQWLASGDLGAMTLPIRAIDVGLEDGHPVYRPHAEGAAGVTALVGMAILLAVQGGTAERMKLCANVECGAAFYDQSRNGSRVWHDVKSCGNVANLRASRARRRAAPPTESDPR